MTLYREQGIVLRTYKLGEADRILHLLTPRRGKVRAVAKGVRRTKSKFGGRLEPFSHVDAQLYEGRSLDIVTQAELLASFAGVRADFALSACGSTMVEAVDRVAQEDEAANGLFLLLVEGLRALEARPAHPAHVVDGFLLRLASVAGYHPYLDACAGCGAPGRHGVFHLAAGGVLCPACAPAGTRPLTQGVLDLLHAYANDRLDGSGERGDEPRVRRAAGALVNSFLTYHLGKPLQSWELVPR